jgi:hypothetical protein
MGSFDNDHTVILIKNRMHQLGVDMDRYIGEITNAWPQTPCGFGFTLKDSTSFQAFVQVLIQKNSRFGTDSLIGGSQHHGVSFREVNQFDSLHVILSTRPDPDSPRSMPVRPTCSIHLDSVSCVEGKDPTTGQVIYDQGKVLQHIATDLLHTPLIVKGSDKGLVLGFRF